MSSNFCEALINNDQATVKKVMEPILRELKPQENQQASFEDLKKWIESHDCVESVEMGPGLLRSEPPLKEFLVRIKGSSTEDAPFRIRVTVYPDKLAFH